MPLDATGRDRTSAQWMRENRTPVAFTKNAVRPAVDAIDTWLDAALATGGSLNTALPTAFRNGATTAQKTDLLMYVLLRRQSRLPTPEDT